MWNWMQNKFESIRQEKENKACFKRLLIQCAYILNTNEENRENGFEDVKICNLKKIQ